jgi:hypothetical protein
MNDRTVEIVVTEFLTVAVTIAAVTMLIFFATLPPVAV